MGNGFGLIAVLSRGALLFSGFVSVLLLIYYWPHKKTIKRVFSSFTIRLTAVALAVYLAFDFMPARTSGRLKRLFFGDELQSGGRGELWSEALHKIAEAPILGHGLGESSVINFYPHNLFLQVGVDGGLFAIILLMVVVIAPLIIFYKAKVRHIFKNDPMPVAFLAAYLWALLEYCKSGDFYKARALFIIASLLIGYLSFLYKKENALRKFSAGRTLNQAFPSDKGKV
jgi:O-antigen ligase